MKINTWQLILIILLVVILVLLCIIYLVLNRGNDKVIELSLKSLLLPVIIAFGLFLIEFLKPVDTFNKDIMISITEDPFIIKKLVDRDIGKIDQINRGTKSVSNFYNKNKEKLTFDNEKNKLEIVEILLLHLIHKKFRTGWQEDYVLETTFFDLTNSWSFGKKNPDKIVTHLNVDNLHKIYPNDHLIQRINADINFTIPKHTTYSVSGDDFTRRIKLKNKFISAEIAISRVGIAKVPGIHGKTAALIEEQLDLPSKDNCELNFYGYIVKTHITSNRYLKWNPNTVEQIKWFKTLTQYLKNSYGWNTIVKRMEENKRLEDIFKSSTRIK